MKQNEFYSITHWNLFLSNLKIPKFHKSSWTGEDDKKLLQSIKENGMESWAKVAEGVPHRNGKQCRERYINHLCPTLKHEGWLPHEDALILQQHSLRGNNWTLISTFLPGRSPNQIKNRLNWLMKNNQQIQFLWNESNLNYYKFMNKNQLVYSGAFQPQQDEFMKIDYDFRLPGIDSLINQNKQK
jgi:hypothetical protein